MFRVHLKYTFAILTAVTFAAVQGSAAQESTTRGFIVGGHLGVATVTVESADASGGAGGGVTFGYGLNRNFTLLVQLDGANIDVENSSEVAGTWTIGHADLGLRFHFANSLRRWVPYIQGGFTGRVVSVDNLPQPVLNQDELSFSGGSFSFGGGLMFYLGQSFAIDATALFSGGQFTDITVGNLTQSGLNVDASSARFNVGLAWWL